VGTPLGNLGAVRWVGLGPVVVALDDGGPVGEEAIPFCSGYIEGKEKKRADAGASTA